MPYISSISRKDFKSKFPSGVGYTLFKDISTVPRSVQQGGGSIALSLPAPSGAITWMTPSEFALYSVRQPSDDVSKAGYAYFPAQDFYVLIADSPTVDGTKGIIDEPMASAGQDDRSNDSKSTFMGPDPGVSKGPPGYYSMMGGSGTTEGFRGRGLAQAGLLFVASVLLFGSSGNS